MSVCRKEGEQEGSTTGRESKEQRAREKAKPWMMMELLFWKYAIGQTH